MDAYNFELVSIDQIKRNEHSSIRYDVYYDEEHDVYSIYIQELRTENRYRGRGFATSLMKSFIRECKEKDNIVYMELEVPRDDKSDWSSYNYLKDFYVKLGFENYYADFYILELK